ncbi:MAG: response regulator [Deltaproteobacteria bacterium]|nr:response regulator [Deltaproteobacteria bacterium]HDH87783.1 response regulator [Desulfobacteraceae bacterium]MBW2106597.1 response regulator [Deltaproteobacteria bacterium]MCD6264674.1 response regulator [Deltaproteobacteria bacterium]RLB17714.1 MAG: response regulator [Deltaproteobacteria bacterium]
MRNKGIQKGSSRKILVVEDNQDNRELVVKVLKINGYKVIEAVDGEEAIEKTKTENPDLILMDLFIPKIDGYEVTTRLKTDRDLRRIPIIALTAHAMKGDMEKALAAGCDYYIPKPIDVRELPNQIKNFLKPSP